MIINYRSTRFVFCCVRVYWVTILMPVIAQDNGPEWPRGLRFRNCFELFFFLHLRWCLWLQRSCVRPKSGSALSWFVWWIICARAEGMLISWIWSLHESHDGNCTIAQPFLLPAVHHVLKHLANLHFSKWNRKRGSAKLLFASRECI